MGMGWLPLGMASTMLAELAEAVVCAVLVGYTAGCVGRTGGNHLFVFVCRQPLLPLAHLLACQIATSARDYSNSLMESGFARGRGKEMVSPPLPIPFPLFLKRLRPPAPQKNHFFSPGMPSRPFWVNQNRQDSGERSYTSSGAEIFAAV